MRPHNWAQFSFGQWLERASQRMHKNKLAAALANKLARIAWSILRSGTAFDARRIEMTAIEPVVPPEFATEITAWNGSRNAPKV